METVDVQKEIVRFLLARLKACALENTAMHAAIFNFSDQAKELTMDMVEKYRQADPIRQKVEKGFQDLDSLVRLVSEALNRESAQKLLEEHVPKGLVN
jgi:hypothetical protein